MQNQQFTHLGIRIAVSPALALDSALRTELEEIALSRLQRPVYAERLGTNVIHYGYASPEHIADTPPERRMKMTINGVEGEVLRISWPGHPAPEESEIDPEEVRILRTKSGYAAPVGEDDPDAENPDELSVDFD